MSKTIQNKNIVKAKNKYKKSNNQYNTQVRNHKFVKTNPMMMIFRLKIMKIKIGILNK